jgi:hypothetical protein
MLFATVNVGTFASGGNMNTAQSYAVQELKHAALHFGGTFGNPE